MSDETRNAAVQWALATIEALRAMDAATRLLHIEAILIVYWGAFWSSAGKEHAKGFLEAQLAGMDASALTPDDNADNVSEEIATMLGIPRALAAEIMYENDESLTAGEWHAVPRSDLELVPHWQVPSILVRDPLVDERRWRYMRNWVASQIKETA